MFGSQVLETIIGLVLMFFVLALAASAGVEAISRLLSWRAKNLEKAIKAMLVGTGGTGELAELPENATDEQKREFENKKKSKEQRKAHAEQLKKDAETAFGVFGATSIFESATAAAGKKVFSNTLFKWRKHPWKKPSYLSAKSFADAIGEMMAGYDSVAELKAAISKAIEDQEQHAQGAAEATGIPAGLAKRLNQLLVGVADDVEGIADQVLATKAGLEDWFDSTMSRVSGAYKRWSTAVLFGFGLFFAVAANASAFHVAQNLWTDPVTREAVAQVAGQVVAQGGVVDDSPTTTVPSDNTTTTTTVGADRTGTTTTSIAPSDNTTTTTPVLTQSDIATVARTTQTLEELQLPIGWRTPDEAVWEENTFNPFLWSGQQWAYVLGWIVTALLVMQGAPFWFDVLNKAVSLRAAGTKPPPAIEDDTSATSELLASRQGAGEGAG